MSNEKLAMFALASLSCFAVGARTIHVDENAPNDPGPGDSTISDPDEDGTPEHPFDCIQEGINAANHFDTVLVADGTYTGACNKNLDFGGKFITVRSENGPETCVIDCEGTGRGFYFHNFESESSVLDGFTITNGTGGYGGGIRCDGSSPTIRDCVITGNMADYGGGVHFRQLSRPTMINCTIARNEAQNGGGLSCFHDSSASIQNCIISGNIATRDVGGGVDLYDGSNAMITNSLIAENTAPDWGGGVYCAGSTAMITNSIISGNSAADGGGIFLNNANVTLTNCVVARNTASGGMGGAMRLYERCNAAITNCTIAGNTAASTGGAIHSHYHSNTTIANSILWGNSTCVIRLWDSCKLTISYTDLQGGPDSVCRVSSTLNWGPGNIDANPFFADPGAGDYRLWSPGSPCIDAGDNGAVPPDITDVDGDGDTAERTPLDRAGYPRFVDDCETPDTGMGTPPIVDIGAYEYQPSDVDADGDVDLKDFASFQVCFTWADSGPVGPGCEGFDADCDGDVDHEGPHEIWRSHRGPHRQISCGPSWSLRLQAQLA